MLIHFLGLLSLSGILPGAKFTLRPPHLALSYWQHYYMAVEVEQWTPAKLCGIEHRAPPIFGRAAIRLGIGPHSSSFLFPRLISAVGDWMSAILPRMVWP